LNTENTKPRIIFGLGNPGAEYDSTPHNIGKETVRLWADSMKLTFEKGPGPFWWTPVRRGVRAVIPATFMNVCGIAVNALRNATDLEPEDFLVVCDDVWLPLGRLRLRSSGSDGGHNGLKSVAEALGSQSYPRLRIGVGPPPDGEDWADFVLRKHESGAQFVATETIRDASEALNLIVAKGVRDAQNIINRSPDENIEEN
jgi:PTH1 family peptidyl-tRNA hydrolase